MATPTGLPAAFVFPNFDLGLGRAIKGIDLDRENLFIGALGFAGAAFSSASVTAGVANTTISGRFVLPVRSKIPKVAVSFSAINALTGHSFNIVSGAGAYTASNTTIPGNDNSSVPGVTVPDSTTGLQTTIKGGSGICTNPGVPGNTFWNADVIINAANFPTATTGNGTELSTGLGLAQILIPNNPDAVWECGTLLTLRLTTPASTGSITNLIIGLALIPTPLSATFPAFPNTLTQPANIVVPGVDY